MRAPLLLLGAALTALASPALAQSSYGGAQVQLDDSFASFDIAVDDADDVAGAAIAGGNAFSVQSNGQNFSVTGSQTSAGDVGAQADAVVWNAWGSVVLSATATANGATAQSVDGGVTIEGAQSAAGDVNASARSDTGPAWAAATSASAAHNVVAANVENGDLTLRVSQNADGDAAATADASHSYTTTAAMAASVASANTINAVGSTTTLLSATTQEAGPAAIAARSELYVGSASDAVSNATANGNTLTLANQWGYLNAAASQTNAADATAESYLTLGPDWTYFAAASAYGVGNVAAISNVGSDAFMASDQTNLAGVRAHTALAGDAGEALVSAAAYGNSVTGALCASCGEASLEARNWQSNAGPVEATATIRAGRTGSIAGSATAIGNAAAYSVTN